MSDDTPADPPRLLLAAAAVASLLTVIAVWAFPHLPATDLPQHEAQVAIWSRLAAPYELQPFTPYLLTTALGRVFAAALGPVAAIKLLLTLGLVGLPLATWALARRTGGDPWWALAAFPLALGFAFRWGFLSYLCALPLALLLVTQAWTVRERADAKRLTALAVLGLALFFTHAIAWGAAVLAAGAVLLAPQAERDLKARLARVVPLLLTAPVALAWVVRTAGRKEAALLTGADPSTATVWNLTPLRLWTFVSEDLLGGGLDAACAAVALLLALAAGARAFRREPARWVPCALLLGLALLAPWRVLGTSHVNGRFAVLAVLLLLPALAARDDDPQRRRARGGLALIAVAWPLMVIVDAHRFSRDHGAHLDAVAAQAVKPGDRIYGWVLDPKLPPRIGDPLLHLPARVAAVHPVTVEPSFARSFAPVVVYTPGSVKPLDEANPLHELRTGGYDLVLLHADGSDADADKLLTGWRRVAGSGPWRAYRRP